MNILILGCGRVGSALAQHMTNEGHQVTIIDISSDAFRRLGPKYKGQKILGTGLDQENLKRAGIENADVFVAATQGDNTNIMAAQVARSVFNVKRVMTRLYDPSRAEAYRELGIDTICTTTLVSGLFYSQIVGDTGDAECRSYLDALDQQMRTHMDL